ncbi:hypothetical protein CQW23_23901 [Capsicum baccatum]|uniref:Heparan-alpha-glucosaminide N-acetyltransferase catalytic domain-containing protein n=1 Tax=Capsicum baccatum TaxID=33114 RepID=A0A2G2VTA4_CAPBA|nr:hypothetical protein CQW23_23901 [Capsicum baccatum]
MWLCSSYAGTQLMMLVDYAGSVFPSIAHSPWNGVRVVDFVMPFFLYVVGVSLAIVNKSAVHLARNSKHHSKTKHIDIKRHFIRDIVDAGEITVEKIHTTENPADMLTKPLPAAKFDHCLDLAGGYLHGINDLTYGVDIEWTRWMGILQVYRVPIVFYTLWVVIWSPYSSIRGDVGPACNSAGMIDRHILGIDHLYAKPVNRNMKECNGPNSDRISENMPSWCHAAFDPEGSVSSLTAAATSIIGLQYGHILVQFQDHKGRLYSWSVLSLSLLAVGLFLDFVGLPLNKSLYTISYMLVTSAAAGITFCLLYLWISFKVDMYGWKRLMFVLEWMGKHSLSIFMLITSNIV